jgi:hypothetical protein
MRPEKRSYRLVVSVLKKWPLVDGLWTIETASGWWPQDYKNGLWLVVLGLWKRPLVGAWSQDYRNGLWLVHVLRTIETASGWCLVSGL